MNQPQTRKHLRLFAAGSLKTAFGEIARLYARRFGAAVETEFGASGLLRERIESGDRPHVFASADMGHPLALERRRLGGPALLFARNALCALVRPGVEAQSETLLDAMLDPAIRLGTSTPKADPSGDYAWTMFRKAEALRPGARAALAEKALTLTGGPASEKAPDGRNLYAWVLTEGRADLFLTYRTNAALALCEAPELRVIALPPPLSVCAEYGLIVLCEDDPAAWRLAAFILSPEAQEVLARYGFDVFGAPMRDNVPQD